MTQLIPADNGLERVKRLQAPLMDGSLPEWVTRNRGDPDALSVFDASNEGGFVRMDSDETLELVSSFEIAPRYPVVELQADVRFQRGLSRQSVGFANRGDPETKEELYYRHQISRLWVKEGGRESAAATPNVAGGNIRRLRLLWYTDEGRAQLFFDGRAAANLEAAPESPTNVSVKVSNSRMDIMSLSVGYYRRSNSPRN